MNRLIASLFVFVLFLATSAQAIVVHPSPASAQPFGPTVSESRSDYTIVLDSAVSGENSCRNNPIDNSDPLGNDPYSGSANDVTKIRITFLPPVTVPQARCVIQAAKDKPYRNLDVLRAPVNSAACLQQADLQVPTHFIGTAMGEQMSQFQTDMIVGTLADPGLALGMAKLGQSARIGRLMVGSERVSLAEARQIEFLSQRLQTAPITWLGQGVAYDGPLYRIVREGYDPLVVHPGNIAASHRYSPSGYGGLYFSSGGRIAEAEIVANGGTLTGARMYSYDKKVFNLLDLTDPNVRASLDVTLDELCRVGGTKAWRYEVTQPLGVWAKEQGYAGVIAPSAHADGGVNLVVFAEAPLP